ncbi:MAG: NAD-dependent epimerase/dehydratase family protein [Bacilli bacterium]|jgi:nucleoside-diphosphate-sugar epimerase|nr:NAD-dependent epimerase/dehydratase family protein [Bacilli bacterium]
MDTLSSAYLQKIVDNFNYLKEIQGKTILVTGGTGFIGSSIIKILLLLNAQKKADIKIVGLARNSSKVASMGFSGNLSWIYQDMSERLALNQPVDYIIHTASPTDSKYFITNPVETINVSTAGLNNILSFGAKSGCKSLVFLSSMEVYGTCEEDRFINENEFFSINPTNVRSSYSEGKRILECLCASYNAEFNLPVKIVRLCQTFGPGISKDDNRVFAQFGRSVCEGRDIVLSTKGETKRSYCSLIDAVLGIFCVLLKGENGEAYNLASDNSYCSIYELAQLFAKDTNSKVIIQEQKDNKYLSTIKFGLDTEKIKKIGFTSIEDLKTMVLVFKKYYNQFIL